MGEPDAIGGAGGVRVCEGSGGREVGCTHPTPDPSPADPLPPIDMPGGGGGSGEGGRDRGVGGVGGGALVNEEHESRRTSFVRSLVGMDGEGWSSAAGGSGDIGGWQRREHMCPKTLVMRARGSRVACVVLCVWGLLAIGEKGEEVGAACHIRHGMVGR